MATKKVSYDRDFLLATASPTLLERRLALAVALVLFGAVGVAAPFSSRQLAQVNAFIPSLATAIFVTDLITAILLFGQYLTFPLLSLLVLAGGYLFTALIVYPHLLTYLGVFEGFGLLGSGLQSTGWLYYFWHFGFTIALLGYAFLRDVDHKDTVGPSWSVTWTIVTVFSLVCALAWLATGGERFLPRIFSDKTHPTPLNAYIFWANIALAALVLALLWFRRRSVLDLWLLVTTCALISELVLVGVIGSARFALGFYAGRIFSLVSSTIVLIVFLSEVIKTYRRTAQLNIALQRERQNKLMNLEAMAASIVHEVKQPLTGITTSGSAILRFLGQTPPNLERAEAAANKVIVAGHNASEILDNIRALFARTELTKEQTDLNEVALDALRALDGDFKSHRISTSVDLAPGLPPIMAHKIQLQEVIINLVHNAIEAMDLVDDDHRMLKLGTQLSADNTIAIVVEDTGPGFDAKESEAIFDAFVTTKPHGMGLGLAICRTIVERHGGQLSASSANPRGAIFRITLPRRG